MWKLPNRYIEKLLGTFNDYNDIYFQQPFIHRTSLKFVAHEIMNSFLFCHLAKVKDNRWQVLLFSKFLLLPIPPIPKLISRRYKDKRNCLLKSLGTRNNLQNFLCNSCLTSTVIFLVKTFRQCTGIVGCTLHTLHTSGQFTGNTFL